MSVIHEYVQGKDRVYDLNKVYPFVENGTIDLRSDDAEVTVVGMDRDDVHLVIHREIRIKGMSFNTPADQFEMKITEDEKGLIIREKGVDDTYFGFLISEEKKYTITMEVPFEANLVLHGDDDEYMISNITGNIALIIDDGDAQLENCRGELYDLEMDDGSLKMDSGSGKLVLRMDDGNISIKDADFVSADVKIDDGDLDLETSLKDGGEYSFILEDGGLNLTVLRGGGEFNLRSEEKINVSGDFNKVFEDEKQSKYTLPGGSARLKFETDDGKIKLSTGPKRETSIF
jgi:hypothetical protein